MEWFTPTRRKAIYNITTSLIAVAVTLGALTQGTADQAIATVENILTALAAISSLGASLLASKHVTKP